MKTGRTLSVLLVAFALLLSFSVCGFAAGEGDLLISDADGLWAFAKEVNENQNSYEGKVVKLTADIDLANVPWTPIGSGGSSFKGTFDGQGYVVRGLYIDKLTKYKAGFFNIIEAATIKNFTVSGDISIDETSDSAQVGIIVGLMSIDGGCRIEKCIAIGRISVRSAKSILIGGIAGNTETSKRYKKNYINNCAANVKIEVVGTGNAKCGGIAGNIVYTAITNSVAFGQIDVEYEFSSGNPSATAGFGGIAGYANGTNGVVQMLNCVTNVDINTKTFYNGGIIGQCISEVFIENCVSNGNLGGKDYVGGIVGKPSDSSEIRNCIATGTISATPVGQYPDFGAISGFRYGKFINCGWLKGIADNGIGGGETYSQEGTYSFDSSADKVAAYTVDPSSLSFNREAGAANPIFRTWPGNDPSAVSEWKTNVVSGVTLKQDTNQNTVISATNKGVFNVGASLTLTATKFGESDVIPLRLAGDTADTSSNPLLAPALAAAVRVTSDRTINVSSIDIKSVPETLSEGSSFQLIYTVLPENADEKGITWSSDNPAVASVDQAGRITALADGSATITAEAADGSGAKKSFTLTVIKNTVPVKSIKITNAPQSLKEGEAVQLSCEVLPEDATNKDLAWSSSNNKVVAVTGQSGEITALLAGETVITVEARDGSGIRDQFTLTVKKDYLSNPKPERPAVKTDTAALSKPEYYGESEIEELAKAISMDKSLLTAKEDGSVILRQDVVGVALESVKKENPGLYYESVMPVPLIKAACGSAESGRIIAFGFTVSGDNFGKADSARDIKVMKVLPDGRGVLFKAIGEEREIEDRSCALYKDGEIYSGPVMPEENYVLTLFIKDGGEFDLDGAENGSVIDPLVVLKAKEAPARESSSGGGCSAGFGGAALLAFAALPVLLRGLRRR